ncbi:MAG: aminotransferase class V-fold PLP-dependent enzyme [Oscillospiraceae bacterium]|nr:aminotransferase class V-fold PLP-dependent enzyme [Oscillospiraceae bacterium]
MRSTLLPMHMPGHKRRAAPFHGELPEALARAFELDITEIKGADDLHDMQGALLETAKLAADLYGAQAAFPMVNGSTGGILAAVRAAARAGGGTSIIIPRAAHCSVYNAAELCGLEPVMLPPAYTDAAGVAGGVLPETVRAALESSPGAAAVLIASPTYEGVVSDVAAIAEIAHARGLPLIVDAAHGAHFGFSEKFPQNASRLGADIEIVSLHKTLPALTQAALALVSGDIIGPRGLERELRVFETSSPSYILLESITACLKLLKARAGELFAEYEENLSRVYQDLAALKNLRLLSETGNTAAVPRDIGKLVITTNNSGMTGPALADTLRDKHGIELEMAAPGFALAMTSVFDTRETLGALSRALIEIDSGVGRGRRDHTPRADIPRRAMSIQDARSADGELIKIDEAIGRTALEYVWAYPPGVPIVVPGDVIDGDAIRAVRALTEAGVTPKSDAGALPYITVDIKT